MNRREYLTAVGATALSSTLPTSAAPSDEVSPADFLVPATEIPDAFTRVSIPQTVPLFEQLRSADVSFADADTALRGFWAEGTEKNPQWVLTTAVCVLHDEVPFESAIAVTEESFHEFIDEYDEETLSFWRFERQHEQHSGYLEWSADIWIDEVLLEGPQREGERHLFTETERLHRRGPVVVWSSLFGVVDPSWQQWSYDQLLKHVTDLHQTKLDAVSDEADDTLLGGSHD